MHVLRQRVPYWFAVTVLFAFSAMQIVLNPFGFSDLTQRYTQDVADLLITGPFFYPATGRDHVSVALIDDQAVSHLQMPWPWSYGAQARALDTLLALKPRAVVVDILFVDPRKDDTLSELVDEIHRFQKVGVPLYFEASPDSSASEPGLRSELAATGVRVLDPTILVNQGVVRQYPATGRCFGANSPSGPCPSLALAVYRDIFPHMPPVAVNGLMELVWGTRSHPLNRKWMRATDENGVSHSCSEADSMSGLRRAWLAFFDPSAVRSSCPYTGVIPVEALLQGKDDADIDALAHNRVIFYGASLEGAQDKSFTPVNGLLANVFVHAMALDNLITFNGRPEQNTVVIAGTPLDGNTVQMIAILPVNLILCWMHMRRLKARRKRAVGQRSAPAEYLFDKIVQSLWHWLSFALGLGVGLALTLAAGLSVANWVEVVFVSVALAAMLLVGVPDAIWGYLHHVAGGVPHASEAGEGSAT